MTTHLLTPTKYKPLKTKVMNNFYHCKECGQVQVRNTKRKTKFIKSYCDTKRKMAKIELVGLNEAVRQMQRYHLDAYFELESFTAKDKLFLAMAFEQGATVMYNKLNPE